MIYKTLGRTGIKASAVAYGGIISMNEEQSDSDRFVSYAIDNGVNYFDVAPGYGNAQEIMGKSIKGYRKDIILACKSHDFTAQGGLKLFEESRRLLMTDYFDIYQLHALSTDEQLEQAFASDGIMQELIKLKESGAIRHIGFSAHNESVALKALGMYDFETILFPFNWAHYLRDGFGKELLKVADNKGIAKLCLKALAQRAWHENEKSDMPKSWYKPFDLEDPDAFLALSYSISLGVDVIVPPGYFSYFKYVVDNYEDAAANELTPDEIDYLKDKSDTATKMFN